MTTPIGDPRKAGESGPAGDQRKAGEQGIAGDPRPAGQEHASEPKKDDKSSDESTATDSADAKPKRSRKS